MASVPGDVGQHIGPYAILDELGRGAFGAVYRARRADSGRPVALKVLLAPGGGPDSDELRRFRREVEAARVLDHPAIVRLIEAGQEPDGRVWFAMDLIEGRPLSAVIGEEPLPWREAARIARTIADALAAAHARGILHRDVKPANILVGRRATVPDGAAAPTGTDRIEGESSAAARAFLTDFGLAKAVATESKLTKTGETLGTPAYMSPEQARGDLAALTPAADVWSVGCVCYEMLTGDPPFTGETTAAVVASVMLTTPPDIRRRRRDVPAGFRAVVEACLAKPPGQRPRDGAALRDALDRVLRGQRPGVRGPRARRAALVLGGLAVAACVGGVVWTLRPPPAAPPKAPTVSAAAARVAKAAELRSVDPRGAAYLLAEALAAEPGHPAWWLELGLLRWATGDDAPAREAWAHIPDTAPEASTARLYRALAVFFRIEGRHLRGDLARPDLEAVARGTGPDAALAQATLAMLDGQWDRLETLTRGNRSWIAAVLRGWREMHRPGPDPGAAERAYTTALTDGMPLAWVHNERGLARRALGDRPGAQADYEAALALDPHLAEALLNRGNAHYEAEDFAAALRDFEAALALRPEDATFRASRAIGRLAVGDREGAKADIAEALQRQPTDARLLAQRAVIRLDTGDPAGAEVDLTEAIRQRPGQASHWTDRARARLNLGRLREACEDADAALERKPGSVLALLHRAEARQRLGDAPGAMADVNRALVLAPDSGDARLQRAAVRRAAGDTAGALADLDAALVTRPRSVALHYARGQVLVEMGDMAGASAAFSAALEIHPDHVDARAARGMCRSELADFTGALADLDLALAAKPDQEIALVNRGYCHLRLGNLPAALRDSDAGVRLAPNEPTALVNRGNARRGLGDPDGAVADFETAGRVLAGAPEAGLCAALVHLARGRKAEAAAGFRRYLDAKTTPAWAVDAKLWLAEAGG